MNNNEKLFLLEHILRDIRGNWGWGLKERVDRALQLADELKLQTHIDSICQYITDCKEGDNDGRFFRMSYKSGGYEGMGLLHGLDNNKNNKSGELIQEINRILTYPENVFKD